MLATAANRKRSNGFTSKVCRGEEIAPDLYAQPGLLMFWTSRLIAPWQTESWLEGERRRARPNAFLRMFKNLWVTSESSFIDLIWWDRCVDSQARPLMSDRSLQIYVGVDASVKRDSTAIVACAYDPVK
jgi:hypothetical protein